MKPYKHVLHNGTSTGEHRAVWERAHGPIPAGYVVHHKNGNKRDNSLENLELLIHEQHSRHHNDRYARTKACENCGREYEPAPTKRKRSKSCSQECRNTLIARSRLGSKNPQSFLTETTIRAIRAAFADGITQKEIILRFELKQQTVSAIILRKAWAHVD